MSRGAVFDLECVEVLKGPQGTLFGQNSTGGAVNFIAAKPTRDFEAGIRLDYGRFDQIDAEAYVSGPISNTLSARVAVRKEYGGAWQKGYAADEQIGEKRFTNGRAIVDWKPFEIVRFELVGNAWRDRSQTQQPQFIAYIPLATPDEGGRPPAFPIASFPAAPHDPRAAAWDPSEDFRRNDRFYQIGLHGDVDLSDALTLSPLTSYADFRTLLPQDFDATIFPIDRSTIHGRIRSFSQELRLSGRLNGGMRWMVGGNYQRDVVFERFAFDPSGNSGDHIGPYNWNSFLIDNLQRVTTKSGFASLDVPITSRLTAQGSARYTDQNRRFDGCTRDNGNGEIAAAFSFLSGLLTGTPQLIAPGQCTTLGEDDLPAPIITKHLNQNNLSWRASLNWKFAASDLVYLNATRGYKAGSFPTIGAATADQYIGVTQESVTAYEAGFKLAALEHHLQLDGAAFYYDYKNKQLFGYRDIAPFGALPSLVNIPKSRVLGAELSAIVQTERIQLSLGGTYVDTKVRRDPPNPTGPFGGVGSFVGQSFPYTPRWQGVADGRYRFPLADAGWLYFGGTVTARSATKGALFSGLATDATDEALLRILGYTLVDLRAGFDTRDGKIRAELWGRNIFNTFYATNATHGADFVYRFTGMPATYGVTLSYRFGS